MKRARPAARVRREVIGSRAAHALAPSGPPIFPGSSRSASRPALRRFDVGKQFGFERHLVTPREPPAKRSVRRRDPGFEARDPASPLSVSEHGAVGAHDAPPSITGISISEHWAPWAPTTLHTRSRYIRARKIGRSRPRTHPPTLITAVRARRIARPDRVRSSNLDHRSLAFNREHVAPARMPADTRMIPIPSPRPPSSVVELSVVVRRRALNASNSLIQIDQHVILPLMDLAAHDVDRCAEERAIVYERVELA